MKNRLTVGSIVLITALVSACGGTAFKKPKEPNQSLIIGALDASEASGSFKGLVMKRIRPAGNKPYYHFVVKDGMFFIDKATPGVYKMHNFTTVSGLKNTRYTHKFPQSKRTGLDIKITEPGIYYVGSWKYKNIDGNFIKEIFTRSGRYDLVKTNSPSELEILKRISRYSEDDYWTNMINKRIQELE